MTIYFAGAIRGGREDAALYPAIVERLREYGEVLTEHVAGADLTAAGEPMDDRSLHDRDLRWLRQADFLVAEVTTPSLGVGYEVGKATLWSKPVLGLFRRDSGRALSGMIAGCADVITREYRAVEELDEIFLEFFLGLSAAAFEAGVPSPTLGLDARLLEYATVDDGVTFTGRQHMIVGDRRLGPVPRLAIAEALDRSGALFLLYCDDDWEIVANDVLNHPTSSETGTVSDLKARAERYYSGITSRWLPHPVGEAAAREYARRMGGGPRCSHCGRRPFEVKVLVEGMLANICNRCVTEMHTLLESATNVPD